MTEIGRIEQPTGIPHRLRVCDRPGPSQSRPLNNESRQHVLRYCRGYEIHPPPQFIGHDAIPSLGIRYPRRPPVSIVCIRLYMGEMTAVLQVHHHTLHHHFVPMPCVFAPKDTKAHNTAQHCLGTVYPPAPICVVDRLSPPAEPG